MCVTETSTSMTTSQFTVSAIRQHFESISYAETANTSNIPLQPGTAAETRKKQPPKTRPKPKTSVMLAARCGNAVKSAGDTGASSQSVAQNVQLDLQPSLSTADDHDQCTARPADNACESQLTTNIRTCEDSTVKSPLSANNLPSDDRSQTGQVSAERVSGDETESEQLHTSVTETASAVPASSLPSDAASHDAREDTNSAEQSSAIAALQLEGEPASQPVCKEVDDDCEVHSHCEINEQRQTTDETSLSADSDTKSFTTSTDNASSITDYTSEPATVMSQPNQLTDTPEQNVECSPATEMLTNDATAINNEEIDSDSRDISGHISQQTRRPISLYPPQDTSELASVHTDLQSSLSVNDTCTSATLGPDRLRRNTQVQSPLTETTFNLRSVQHPHVVPSRKSYLVIKEYIGQKFSFLDDDLHDRVEMPVSIADCGKEQTATATSTDQANCAATAELCTQHRCNEQEHTTSAEKTRKNDRPKSLLHKSIILPNGDVLETIFSFLDDYEDQILVHDFPAE